MMKYAYFSSLDMWATEIERRISKECVTCELKELETEDVQTQVEGHDQEMFPIYQTLS